MNARMQTEETNERILRGDLDNGSGRCKVCGETLDQNGHGIFVDKPSFAACKAKLDVWATVPNGGARLSIFERVRRQLLAAGERVPSRLVGPRLEGVELEAVSRNMLMAADAFMFACGLPCFRHPSREACAPDRTEVVRALCGILHLTYGALIHIGLSKEQVTALCEKADDDFRSGATPAENVAAIQDLLERFDIAAKSKLVTNLMEGEPS